MNIDYLPRIDLVCLGKDKITWPLGEIILTPKTVAGLDQAVQKYIAVSKAEFVLFWDPLLGVPDPTDLLKATRLCGDVWHAGLLLGMGGLPGMIDFVKPTWMLNRDPDPIITATSWRLSLRACLMRKDVIQQLGGIDSGYDTLTGASLEMGHRYITRGAIVRHVPKIIDNISNKNIEQPKLSIYDELRFVKQIQNSTWVLYWSLWRAVMNGYPFFALVQAFKRLLNDTLAPLPLPFNRNLQHNTSFRLEEWNNKVSILIPTLERYPYLRNELKQLQKQTVKPLEIIVIDQTPAEIRETNFAVEFLDLPLRVFYQNKMGQCTAWNEGLLASKGEYLLFLGDDADEIEPDFLERFFEVFHKLQVDMVASKVDEVGREPMADEQAFMRIADSFPITMIRRKLLCESGLMDFAYDRGIRADQDLGLRCYLSGGIMVFAPDIRILHLRASRGGLRKHNARVITYASSRSKLIQRHLPNPTEIYLAKKFFTLYQVHEMLLLRILGTFSIRGRLPRKFLKMLVSLAYLPNTIWEFHKRNKVANSMSDTFPQMPVLGEVECQNSLERK